MTLILVNSTAIRTGRIYDHPGVPYSVYAGFMNASSMGAYYNRCICSRYR